VVEEVGAWYAQLHRTQGCALHTHARVDDVVESGSGVAVHLADGGRVAADIAVVGLGVVPNTEIAAEAGLRVEDGVVVDAYGRTSHPTVFAAGDVTRHFNPLLGRSLRLETWHNAQNQAVAVGRTVAGHPEAYADVPWVWSDQYGVNLQAAGFPAAWDRLAWRGSREEGRFSVLYLAGERLVGAITVDNGREMRSLRKLIAASLAGRTVDLDRAGDPAADLAALARSV
jgi:3-phenylpropionate/trans-cinnamate dioxygenase ferredoxin reductase subunit